MGTSYYTYLGTLGTDLIPELPCYYTSPTVPVPHVLHLHPPDCHEIEPRDDDDISTSYLLPPKLPYVRDVTCRRVASVGERAPARLIPHLQPPTDTCPHIHYVMASAQQGIIMCLSIWNRMPVDPAHHHHQRSHSATFSAPRPTLQVK